MRRLAKNSAIVLLALGSFPGCRPGTPPTAPVVATPTSPSPSQPDPRGGIVYVRASTSISAGSSGFVLYPDETFVLQYPQAGFPGRYARSDSTVAFFFDGWSSAGSWGAVGTLRGDTLRVKFSETMVLSDFEDGVYVHQ